MQEYFEVGQIVNTFGVKGMVKVNPFTDEMQRFEEAKSKDDVYGLTPARCWKVKRRG